MHPSTTPPATGAHITALGLLRHELRLVVRHLRLDRWAFGRSGWITLLLLGGLVLHVLPGLLALGLPAAAPDTPALRMVIGAFAVMILAFISMTALSRSVEALFERRDLDLLFSAPVPPRRVLLVRLVAITVSTVVGHALWLVPIANVGILSGRLWLAGLYPFLVIVAFTAAGVGVLLSLTLVTLIGARRTRVLMQVLAVVCGLLVYLISQLSSRVSWQADAFDPSTALGARVLDFHFGMLAGEPLPLGALALVGAICWALAYGRLARAFLTGTQQLQEAPTQRKRSAAAAVQVPANVLLGICIKEWRCIVRAPLILVHVGASVIYLAPAAFAFFGLGGQTDHAAMIVIGSAVLGAAQLAISLAVLTVNMDEAPALAAAAPRAWPMMVRAKVIAAVIPAAALAGLLLIAAASQVGAASLAALPIVLISAWSAAAAVGADQKQVSRELFGKNNGADLPLQLLIFLIAALLTAAAVLLVTAYWLVGVILAALLLIFPVQQWRKLATLRADRLLA